MTPDNPPLKQGELVDVVARAIFDAQHPTSDPTVREQYCQSSRYRAAAKKAIEASGLVELEEANRVLTRELASAAGIFRAYEALHLEKGTPDGNEKAKRNAGFAESIERTLAALTPSGDNHET